MKCNGEIKTYGEIEKFFLFLPLNTSLELLCNLDCIPRLLDLYVQGAIYSFLVRKKNNAIWWKSKKSHWIWHSTILSFLFYQDSCSAKLQLLCLLLLLCHLGKVMNYLFLMLESKTLHYDQELHHIHTPTLH